MAVIRCFLHILACQEMWLITLSAFTYSLFVHIYAVHFFSNPFKQHIFFMSVYFEESHVLYAMSRLLPIFHDIR